MQGGASTRARRPGQWPRNKGVPGGGRGWEGVERGRRRRGVLSRPRRGSEVAAGASGRSPLISSLLINTLRASFEVGT